MSTYKTTPLLRGTLGSVGPWKTIFAQAGQKIYPYTLGTTVKDEVSSSGTITTYTMGDIVAGVYLLVCRAVDYGEHTLYIPDTSRITKVISDGTDTMNVSPTITVYQNEYLFNLGTEATASEPLKSPEYDGSLTVYSDPGETQAAENNYLVTGTGGGFRGWLPNGTKVVDLLILDSSGVPRVAIPLVTVGAEVLA